MSAMLNVHRRLKPLRRLVHRLRPGGAAKPYPDVVRLTPADRKFLKTLHDDRTPLPEGAQGYLSRSNPRLRELRAAYDDVDLPVCAPSRWHEGAVDLGVDLHFFRGDTMFMWQYRELPRITELKYFVFANYIAARDDLGLLERLGEDGAFGCWTYRYEGRGAFSRDLLDSVNELLFLERQLSLSSRPGLSVIDIGAGYGRLGHRMTVAHPQLADYCCLDAVPESTFLCEYYLRQRGCTPPARAVPLHEVAASLKPDSFDLGVNIHSFSEMPLAAVSWWIGLLADLRVPHLFLIGNDGDRLVSLEEDGCHESFSGVLHQAGYRLTVSEPVIQDPAVRELLALTDCFQLFALSG
ncbi:MAG: hypothetical protein ACR2ND_06570 [Solirubrobacteraceae bacterium]